MFSACQALKTHLNDATTLSSTEMVCSFQLSKRGNKITVSVPVSVCLSVCACVCVHACLMACLWMGVL